MSLKSKLNELLANGKLVAAIDLLMENTKSADPDTYNSLILLKSRFTANERDNSMGVISRGDYQRSNNQIIYAFQQTMDRVPKNIMEGDSENVTQTSNQENNFSKKENESNMSLLNMLIVKKNQFEKELVMTYDSEKKFALNAQIEELERRINDLKLKVSGSSNTISVSNNSSGNIIVQDIKGSNINIGNLQNEKKTVDKKQVLFICSSPSGKNPLDFGAEFKKIKEALRQGAKRDFYEIEIETGVESDNLINKLTAEPYPSIVHISMHSSKSEGMYFEDGNKNDKPMSVEDFRDVFALMSEIHKPELVILSACNSIKHAEAIKPYANYVVGTKDFFPDKIAIMYANKLYEMIFDGKKIDFAHKTAVLSIKQAPVPEEDRTRVKTPLHEIPVLLT